MKRTLRLSLVLLLVGLLAVSTESQNEDWGPAKVAYDDYIKRPSLLMRTRGRLRLARTGHPGAFEILSRSYANPEQPREQVKYLLASITADHFRDEAFVEPAQKWREAHTQPIDAWLWHRTLINHYDNRGDDDLIAVASDQRLNLFIRAAAIEALNHRGSEKMPAWWTKQLEGADKWRDIERAVMLEAAANTFRREAHLLGTDDFRNFGLKLIPLIEHRDTHARTSLVMARYFRDAFRAEQAWVNARPWLDRLLNPVQTEPRDDRYGRTRPPTRFVGVEATGQRIVYVIDLSDSMLAPLTGRERDEIRRPVPRGPVTGRGADSEPERKPRADEKDIAEDLPWDRIRTRFDAAREYLKLSLQGLEDDQFFCVIWFGNQAEPLRATRTLVQANRGNITAAIRELDAIRPGPATPDRRFGTLKGNTNLHGGLHRAFKVHQRGILREQEYIDPTVYFSGADTIFLFSDGDPTWDDWPQRDRRDPWDQTGDPESRTPHPDQEILEFPGPYGHHIKAVANGILSDDIRRLNLFRRCEIHCIGIGEVSYGVLAGIARWGDGQIKMVGN